MKTKKNKVTNLLKIGILFFGISLLLWNCEKDEVPISPPVHQSTVKSFKIDVEDIPEVTDFIKISTNLYAKGASVTLGCGNIDFTAILTSIDSLQTQTYTFPFDVDEPASSKEFYNFVIKKNKDNSFNSYVLKYIPSNNYKIDTNYNGSSNSLFYFEGIIEFYDYNSFCLSKTTAAKTSNTNFCPPNYVRIGGGSGSQSSPTNSNGSPIGGNNNWGLPNSSTGGSTSGGGGFTQCFTKTTWSCKSGGTGPHTKASCGAKTGGIPTVRVYCPPNFSKGNCPTPNFSGTVSLNHRRIMKKMKDKLTMTSERLDWLGDSKNTSSVTEMSNFLEKNKDSDKAKDFAEKTIDLLSNKTLTEEQKLNQFKVIDDAFDPYLADNLIQDDYEAKIRHYIKQFNRWGNKEFGSYLASLLPLDKGYAQEDYFKLYETIKNNKSELFWDYLKQATFQTVKSFQPVIEMALWEVGGGLAFKVLSKLPIKYLTTPIKNVIKQLSNSTSTAFSKLKHAKKYGIQSYKQLAKEFKDLGLSAKQLGVERHHLIEKRFINNPKITQKLLKEFGKTTDDWLSIVVEKTNKLTQSEHYLFSKSWRDAIGINGKAGSTGFHTTNVPYHVILDTAKKIYKDYPEILKALGL